MTLSRSIADLVQQAYLPVRQQRGCWLALFTEQDQLRRPPRPAVDFLPQTSCVEAPKIRSHDPHRLTQDPARDPVPRFVPLMLCPR